MRDVARDALLTHLKRKRVGDRLPPIKQLARELNVGESNLLRAMQDLQREGIVYSRKRVGTYVAQPVGRGKDARQDPRRTLAGKRITLFHQPTDDMIVTMQQAAYEVLAAQGATVSTPAHDWTQAQSLRAQCDEADMTVLFNPPRPGSWKHLGSLDEVYNTLHCPIVVVSTAWTRGTVGGFDYDLVGIDQEEAGRLAGERLHNAGHRSACFIGRRIEDTNRYSTLSAARLRGFERGLGARLQPEHCIKTLGYSLLSGGMAFQAYEQLSDRPRAVFAATDELAVGFRVGAASQGLKEGVDFDLLGVDGLSLGQRESLGPLATVELPAREMGRAGGELVAQRLQQPDIELQTTILPCRVREGVTIGV